LLRVGSEIERYQVQAVLGRGGAGTVYAVQHQTLGTRHALKVLHIASPVMRARFIEEGRIQARLRHANIVHVSDVLDVGGHPGLLMDYVAGGSLAERIHVAPVRLLDVVGWARDTVAGVQHAHSQRVTHRDLKPANVLLTNAKPGERAIARVTDFGLARVLGGGHPSLTQMGSMLGTPAYMAPEQVLDPRGIDERADIFSLGVLLYEISTGSRPFEGGDIEAIFMAARSGTYAPPEERVPALPVELCALIARCLSPDRDRRPDSCAVLLELLEHVDIQTSQADAPLWSPAASTSDGPAVSRTPVAVPVRRQVASPDTIASLFAREGLGDSTDAVEPLATAGHTLANWGSDDLTPRVEVAPLWPVERGESDPPPTPPSPVEDDGPARSSEDASPHDAEQPAPPRARARAVGVRAIWMLVPLLAAGLSWTGAAEARLAWWILDAFRAPVIADNVGLVAISVDDPTTLRPSYPAMLRALRDAGAQAVVFDVALTRPSPHDEAIAEAIIELGENGVPVIFPVRFSGSDPEPPASMAIREAARLGLVESTRGSADGLIHQLEARRFLADGETVWHLALAGAAAAQGIDADGIAVEGDDIRVGEHRVPAPGRLLWLTPTTAPPYVPHDAPDRFHELEDRVVFVGAHGRNRDEFLTPAGIRYGVELIAMMTQAVLSDAVPRRLGAGADALAALLAGLISLLIGRARSWAGWVSAGAFIAMAIMLSSSGTLLALVPLGTAGLLGAWAGQGGTQQ
jgi:serine/threonine protein kinase/CHASE2 domain-containing sensor protein